MPLDLRLVNEWLRDAVGDVWVVEGKISEGKGEKADRVIEAKGLVLQFVGSKR